MWSPLIVLVAQLATAPASVREAYQKLTSAEIEAKKTTHEPPADARKLDVSSRIRSTSFGHKTWLFVAADGEQFWIEHGASTNRPGATYGPFAVARKAAPATEK